VLTNVDQGGLRGRNNISIHNRVTAQLGCDKISSDCQINCSSY